MPRKRSQRNPKQVFRCIVCSSVYASKSALRHHAKKHVRAFDDIKRLASGFIPEETKVGTKFKGKNKVIIS